MFEKVERTVECSKFLPQCKGTSKRDLEHSDPEIWSLMLAFSWFLEK